MATREVSLVVFMPHLFLSISGVLHTVMMSLFHFVSFDLAAMKRHQFVTRTSEFGNLIYIVRFGPSTLREILLPAPLLFDSSRKNRRAFNFIQFDEFVVQQQ